MDKDKINKTEILIFSENQINTSLKLMKLKKITVSNCHSRKEIV